MDAHVMGDLVRMHNKMLSIKIKMSHLNEHVDSLAELLHFFDLLLQPLDMLVQGLQHLHNSEVVLMSQCSSKNLLYI